jgi:predicted small metal-binding protein
MISIYSKNFAKKNGIRNPIVKFIILFVFMMIAIPILFLNFLPLIGIIVSFLCLILFIYLLIKTGTSYAKMFIAYVSNNNELYRIRCLRNGVEYAIAGKAIHMVLDNITKDNFSIGTAFEITGGATMMYTMNQSFKFMQNPDLIMEIIKNSPNINGFEVIKIKKINSFKEEKQKYILNCNFIIETTNKEYVKRKIIIYKCYNNLDKIRETITNIINHPIDKFNYDKQKENTSLSFEERKE